MKTTVMNVKAVTYSVIAISAMLTLSNCRKVQQEPSQEPAEVSQELVLVTPDMKCTYEEQVKVYSNDKKNYLTYVVKSNSKSQFEEAVISMKASKIEIIDAPKMVYQEPVHAHDFQSKLQPGVNPNDFVMINVIDRSFEKGKAVKLSVKMGTEPVANGANRTSQVVSGTSNVYFGYFSSAHQILNSIGVVTFRDYRLVNGTATLIEDFVLGGNTNHIDSQGQNTDRMLHASTFTPWPNNYIVFDITYW